MMSGQELALKIQELRSVIGFLAFVGFLLLLVFGPQIVDAICSRHKDEDNTGGK